MKDLLGFADNPAYSFSLANSIDLGNDQGLYIPIWRQVLTAVTAPILMPSLTFT